MTHFMAQGVPFSNTLLLSCLERERETVTLEQTTFSTEAVPQLLESFTNLPPVVLQNKDPPVPQDTVKMRENFRFFKAAITEEHQWLDTVMDTTEEWSRHFRMIRVFHGQHIIQVSKSKQQILLLSFQASCPFLQIKRSL